MKKILTLIIIIIAGLSFWKLNNFINTPSNKPVDSSTEKTESIPVSQTITISSNISEYKNDELGFSVKYPTLWEKSDSLNNVLFIISVDKKEKNTIRKLESNIDVFSGKCTFPPVTLVKERSNLVLGDLKMDMISIANSVQKTNYFYRMYSLQKDSICYFFTFSSITSNPSTRGFTGSDIQKVNANNVKIVDNADTQFKDMVKSFKFVVGPVGQDETKFSPKK